jgi:amino acid transporter
MANFLSTVFVTLYAVALGGLIFLVVKRRSKGEKTSPAVAVLGLLMAVGIPVLFLADGILSIYSFGKSFTNICLGVLFLTFLLLSYGPVKRIHHEKRATRDEVEITSYKPVQKSPQPKEAREE